MNRSQHHPTSPGDHRTRLTLAAITGLVAGLTRALSDWLLDHLTIEG